MALFKKILVANRGEIACRIMGTARRLGIETVAVFSEADTQAAHVKLADEAYLIGPAPSRDSYLNIEKIIAIAKQTHAEAIHPGYGFLSENPDFAKACKAANLVFVGPSPTAMILMADKNIAKEKMAEHNIPVLPGYFDERQQPDKLLEQAKVIGFPVVLKAVAGGGGKGLRLVMIEQDFSHSLDAVRREAKAFFNDDRVLVEKYLSHARHIEVQILADHFGTVHHLYTRDCSIQRRHQKIVEEAPAPNISEALQDQITAAAVQVAKTIQYSNAGTIEFLVEQNAFYFMEMNTRLQVEHPVTEMITGLDIVEWQFRIASGEPLFEALPPATGHAIELRLNAEDPEKDFIPSAGKLAYFELPANEKCVRIDSGYQQSDNVNIYYDSLLAKIIVWGETRTAAIDQLRQTLSEVTVFGIKTNLTLLKNIAKNKNFVRSQFNTHFLQKELIATTAQVSNEVYAMASLCLLQAFQHKLNSPWQKGDGWRLYFPSYFSFQFMSLEKALVVERLADQYKVQINNQSLNCILLGTTQLQDDVFQLEFLIEQKHYLAKFFKINSRLEIMTQGNYYHLELGDNQQNNQQYEQEAHLLAPMPGTLVALMVDSGQAVSKGDKLLVIEAMKMEHTLYAPRDGKIKLCHYKIGDLVQDGAELLEYE